LQLLCQVDAASRAAAAAGTGGGAALAVGAAIGEAARTAGAVL